MGITVSGFKSVLVLTMSDFFHSSLTETDALIGDALSAELNRQQNQIELIASENIVSQAVLDALAHPITNKTLEGYPGARFHGGGQFVDIVEQAAIDRAKELFACDYVNVQPHSGTQANQAVFFSLLKPGDRILSLNLAAGGHLSHGAKPNLSGQWFDSHHYGVNRQSGLIDYDETEDLARKIRPKLLIAGGSAYPRVIDFERLADIAKSVDAVFLVDMAHFAGLVAADVHPSPISYADIVTCTTTKTMRGPRGGLILTQDSKWARQFQSAVFPGVQGSLHSQIIAAKAVCLGEALKDDFKVYAKQIIDNARTMAQVLSANGIKLVSGGTDTHMVLLDLSAQNLTGQQLQDALARANITSNKNPIPFDSNKPSEWSGLRLGLAAATTRGFGKIEITQLGEIIAGLINRCDQLDDAKVPGYCDQVAKLCESFPIYNQ